MWSSGKRASTTAPSRPGTHPGAAAALLRVLEKKGKSQPHFAGRAGREEGVYGSFERFGVHAASVVVDAHAKLPTDAPQADADFAGTRTDAVFNDVGKVESEVFHGSVEVLTILRPPSSAIAMRSSPNVRFWA